jgi:23S rRNA pseudouridine2605 synthase
MISMAGKEKPDTPEGERIAKVLSRAGVASRREAERLIELGEVKVNGKVITSPALNVTPADKISVRGEPVGQPEPPRLWLYYKPEGLVTSASDEKGRDTVFDHLPEDMPRVMSIGRLDLNSEGLLLLTNDGALKRRLELPSTGWLRKYRVRVNGNPTEPEIEPLRKGITVDGDRFQPMEVKIDRHQGANAWLTVGLREGKNREIRRAMAHIGLTVNRLIRVSYGPFRLNELKPGEVEEIKPRILREQLGLAEEGADAKVKPAVRRAPRPAANTEGAKATATAKSKAPLPAGEGQRRLSEAWQKATRGPANKLATGRGDDRPGKAPARPGRPPVRPGPRPKGPRGG